MFNGLYAASLVKMAEFREEDAVQLHQEDANMKGKITHVFPRSCNSNRVMHF